MTRRRTVFRFIASKVSPVAEQDLQVVALVQGGQDPQQQQDDPQTSSQLQTIHVCSHRDRREEGVNSQAGALHVLTEFKCKMMLFFFYNLEHNMNKNPRSPQTAASESSLNHKSEQNLNLTDLMSC